jgi:hypothetical protein
MSNNMSFIECGTCSVPGRAVNVPLLHQFPVRGIPTFEYHCTACNGKVHLQIQKNPHTGETFAKQIRLTGAADEFRPNAIRPNTQMQIPVAYTLGGSPNARHVKAEPVMMPDSAYKIGGNEPRRLPPNHPMHPSQLRRRLRPVRWQQ